jgi:hypothetical protein
MGQAEKNDERVCTTEECEQFVAYIDQLFGFFRFIFKSADLALIDRIRADGNKSLESLLMISSKIQELAYKRLLGESAFREHISLAFSVGLRDEFRLLLIELEDDAVLIASKERMPARPEIVERLAAF